MRCRSTLIPPRRHLSLKADFGPAGKQALCALVSKVLLDKEFIAQHLTADQCRPRKVLYEDPELGFCICGHVYETPAHGTPHDHGSSWAIYGVALGDTEMTDWRIVQRGDENTATLVAPARTLCCSRATRTFMMSVWCTRRNG